jgi:exodeoxyribonuclease VIII
MTLWPHSSQPLDGSNPPSSVEIIPNLSYAAYDARPGLRSGYLATADKRNLGIAEFIRTHPDEADKECLILGSALHCLILEPQRFAQEWTVGDGPTNPTTGSPYGSDSKKYREWLMQQIKPVLTRAQYEKVLGMADAVAADPDARVIRDNPRKTELSVFWEQDGVPCKCRLDCAQPKLLWDIKSCRDATEFGFMRSIADYRYHLQAAFYLMGACRAGLAEPTTPFQWLCVENTPPFATHVMLVPIDLLGAAHDRVEKLIEQYAACRKSGQFPTLYPKSTPTTPKWMLPKEEIEL